MTEPRDDQPSKVIVWIVGAVLVVPALTLGWWIGALIVQATGW